MRKLLLTCSLILLTLCLSKAQNESSFTIDETLIELSVKERDLFGGPLDRAKGENYLKLSGSLSTIIRMIDPKLILDISDNVEKMHYTFMAKGPSVSSLKSHRKRIIKEIAKIASFDWSIDKKDITFWQPSILQAEVLSLHLNKEEGVESRVSISNRYIKQIGKLQSILWSIHSQHFREHPLDLSRIETEDIFDFDLQTDYQKQMIRDLELEYGIRFEKAVIKTEVLTVK